MPQNPQFKLVDANDAVLGSIYATEDGEVAIHHELSDQEAIFGVEGLDIRSIDANSISVSSAPSTSTEVARQSEIDALDAEKVGQEVIDALDAEKADQTAVESLSTTVDSKADQEAVNSLSTTVDSKADQDGSGTATLSNYASVETDDVTFSRPPATETTGLGYDEWIGSTNVYGAGTSGPRIRSNIDGELRITGATVDADSAGETEVVLKEINADDTHGATVDTSPISVTQGRNELEFDIIVPDTGDDYVLSVPSSNTIGFASISDDTVTVPYPIEGDLLTILYNSHEDGYIGPRDNYYRYFDIDVEEVEPGTASVSLRDDNAVSFEKVAANVQNGVRYAPPGDVQAVLDNSDQGEAVHLYPGETYSTPEEIVVPRGVRLIGNGATIEPDSDHNAFFLEPDCHLKNLRISVGHLNYTSKAVEINTERMGDTYHGGGGGTVIEGVDINGSSTNMSGDGVYIRVGPNQWYSANQHHQFNVSGMGNGLHVDVDSAGHANANIFKCSLWNNSTQLRHSGNGPFESQIIGELDASDSGAGTEHMIVNEPSTGRTCVVYGKMYDPFNCSGDYLVGWINMVHHNRPHVSVVENSPNAHGLITAQDRNELLVVDLGAGMSWRREYYAENSWLRFQVDTDGGRNFSDIMSFRMDTGQVRITRELVTNSIWPTDGIDLGGGASISTNSNGEVVIRDENGATLTTGS